MPERVSAYSTNSVNWPYCGVNLDQVRVTYLATTPNECWGNTKYEQTTPQKVA